MRPDWIDVLMKAVSECVETLSMVHHEVWLDDDLWVAELSPTPVEKDGNVVSVTAEIHVSDIIVILDDNDANVRCTDQYVVVSGKFAGNEVVLYVYYTSNEDGEPAVRVHSDGTFEYLYEPQEEIEAN